MHRPSCLQLSSQLQPLCWLLGQYSVALAGTDAVGQPSTCMTTVCMRQDVLWPPRFRAPAADEDGE